MLLKAILLTKVLELSAATDTLSLGRTCRSMPLSCAWITAGLEVRCHHLDIDDSFRVSALGFRRSEKVYSDYRTAFVLLWSGWQMISTRASATFCMRLYSSLPCTKGLRGHAVFTTWFAIDL